MVKQLRSFAFFLIGFGVGYVLWTGASTIITALLK